MEHVYDYNYNKLKYYISERVGTQKMMAEALGMTYSTFSKKISNKRQFSQNEIVDVINVLNLTDEEIRECFFTKRQK